ncbi:MAG: hypothetical protein AAF725_10065 [Acidobacteriota bacterium]
MMPALWPRDRAEARDPRPSASPSDSRTRLLRRMLMSCLLLGAVSAEAQYIPDIGTITRSDIPEKEALETAHDEARWKFGGLSVQPWIGIRDASLVTAQDPDDPDQDSTDLTLTAGAGVRAYLKPSAKITVAAHVLPEYVWWQDREDRRQLNGRYGAGVFGHANRFDFELSFRRTERQRFFSSEIPLLSSSAQDAAKVAVSFELSRGISLYAVGQRLDVSGDDDDLEIFTLLDRSEEILAGGIRLESRRGLWADLGIEESTVDFEGSARSLSNEGTTVGVGVGFSRGRLSGSLDLAFRDIEPQAGSLFVPFDDTTGAFNFAWNARRLVGILLFAERGQTYSVDPNQSYLIGDRYGATVQFSLGQARLQLTGALGEDDYEGLSDADRFDDVEEWRASLTVPLGDLFVLGIEGSQLDYDSNFDAFDRTVTSYGVNLRLGKIVERLSIGDGESTW